MLRSPIPFADALAWLGAQTETLPAEMVPVPAAAGRMLAAVLRGSLDAGPVAAIDGYAVRATETEGASEYAPLPVRGAPIVAGANLPGGTDAVLPLTLLERGPSALGPVASRHGVMQGDPVLVPAGTPLRPTHLALLALMGCESVPVVRRPRVAIRVAGAKSGPDGLMPMLSALVAACGGEIAADRPDLHLHAGRSGPGPDDDGINAFATVFAHGILIRPGETAGLGTIGGRPAILLPGEPLACAVIFALLAAPFLRGLVGAPEPRRQTVTLTGKIVSGLGQIDAVLVRRVGDRATQLGPAGETPLAALLQADGLALVPEGSEGYPEGAMIAIHPFP